MADRRRCHAATTVAWPLAMLLALAGCKLIDQRTFEHAPTAPSAAAVAKPALPPLPLLTIRFADPDADWHPAVADAVLAAQTRKPDVRFEVVTPIPTAGTPEVQAQYTKTGQADAQLVSLALQSDGVPPERITIAFRGDAGAPPREVRLYAQ